LSVSATPTTIRGPRRAEQRAERRGAILAATVRILGSSGLGAVTHRAVAQEAGVPLAATTYYFSSKDELITDAVSLLVDEEVAQLAERAAALGDGLGSPDRAAEALVQVLVPDSATAGAQLAKFELYLEAARRPGLRESAAHWQDAFIGLAQMVLHAAGAPDPSARAALLVPAVDGVLMYELSLAGEEPVRERLRRRFAGILELVLADARK
jgi:TetR/AcrR family transcriptional regulator, regulator of biofilm formation and stress response